MSKAPSEEGVITHRREGQQKHIGCVPSLKTPTSLARRPWRVLVPTFVHVCLSHHQVAGASHKTQLSSPLYSCLGMSWTRRTVGGPSTLRHRT